MLLFGILLSQSSKHCFKQYQVGSIVQQKSKYENTPDLEKTREMTEYGRKKPTWVKVKYLRVSGSHKSRPKQKILISLFFSLFCRTRQRECRFFEFQSFSSDFISQTTAAHSDRNVSARASPCPAQLSALSSVRSALAPLPLPRPGQLGGLARSLLPPGARPTPGPLARTEVKQ